LKILGLATDRNLGIKALKECISHDKIITLRDFLSLMNDIFAHCYTMFIKEFQVSAGSGVETQRNH